MRELAYAAGAGPEFEALQGLRRGLGVQGPWDLAALPPRVKTVLGINEDTEPALTVGLRQLTSWLDTASPADRQVLVMALNVEQASGPFLWMDRVDNFASENEWAGSSRNVRQKADEALLRLTRRLLDAPAGRFEDDVAGQVGASSSTVVHAPARLDQKFHQLAAGSTRYTIADVVNNESIYLGVPWRRLGERMPDSNDDLGDLLVAVLTEEAPGNRYLIVAPAGSGKSTLTLRLLSRLGPSATHVDLSRYKDERANERFATAAWLRQEYPNAGAAPFLLLDSLDELLSGLQPLEIDRLLERDLFQDACVVTCRRSFFERYLAGSPFSESFAARYELVGLDPDQQDRLAHRYLLASFPGHADVLTDTVVAWLKGGPERRAICSVPLHLLLAVESVSPDQDLLSDQSDLVGLWQAHVDQVLTREAHRPGGVLDRDNMLSLLEAVAWHFYDEEGAGNADPPLFTRDELLELLRRRGSLEPESAVLDTLEHHTLLTSSRGSRIAEAEQMLRFNHASLHNYFVARRLYRSMLTDSDDAHHAFSKFISAEVSRLLLEFVTRLGSERRLAGKAVTSLTGVATNAYVGQDALSRARNRISRQQSAYYLGAIGGPTAKRQLATMVATETDVWVKRGMAIALSLAGDQSALDDQIAERRRERLRGDPAPLCGVNFGYHLSFAGDQPLDILAPDVDQGDATCTLTVATLIRQLQMPEKRGSWRSTLFTFVDLATNRPASADSFAEAVRRDLDRLLCALERMEGDPTCSSWPELGEASQVVARVCS